MKVMAQIAMVMNLDKCIGCHTCSVTCKQVWTNREGTEYIWFNNVETRPGVGYPRGWEDQKKWKGGWKRTATGRLVPRQGGRVASLAKIFANPTQPTMKDYYEPWTYEYDKLLQAPANSRAIPTARAKSKITGEHIDKPEWGPNWDDDLGGSMETLDQDPVLHQMNLEVGQPTICSETCVGRLRYMGVLLYDADRVTWAASQEDERDLYRAQREILLDPNDPQVVAQAQANGVPHSWITAAQQSPIWKLITEYEVALPLHPEFRTLPMVWYVPPLSPVVDQVTASGNDGEDHRVLLSAISQMRIPLEYLAGLFTAGDTAPVELALRRLAAMRSYMRDVFVDNPTNEEIPASVGMSPEKVKEMYRLLSIAKYDDRFVIPTAHPEMPRGIKDLEGCPVSYDVEAFHGMAPATSNRPMGGSSPEGRVMLPLEVVR